MPKIIHTIVSFFIRFLTLGS